MRVTLEGITAELAPPKSSITLKKSRMPGVVAKFKCECGIRELSITSEMIKSVPFHHSSATAFGQVKASKDYIGEVNLAYGPDFVRYAEKLQLTRQKWAAIENHPAYSSTMQVKCPACKRVYSITVDFSHDLEPHPPITNIEALKRFGLNESHKTKIVLARVAFLKGFADWPELKRYLVDLLKETEVVHSILDSLGNNLKKTAQKNPPKTPTGQKFIDSLALSLNELHQDFQQKAHEKLEALLRTVFNETIAEKIEEEGGEKS